MRWVKLYSEWLHDEKLAECSEGARLLFIACLSIAGDCEADGALVTGENPMTIRGLGFRANMSDETIVSSRLAELAAVGLVTVAPPAPIVVANFTKRQIASGTLASTREAAKARVAQRRSRPVLSNTDDVLSNTPPSSVEQSIRIEENRIEENRIEENRVEKKTRSAPKARPDASPSAPVEPAQPDTPKPLTEQQINWQWVTETCTGNYSASRIGKISSLLAGAGATADQRAKFGRWWPTFWKSKNGQAPTPEDVWQQWPVAQAWDGAAKQSTRDNGQVEIDRSFRARYEFAFGSAQGEIIDGN